MPGPRRRPAGSPPPDAPAEPSDDELLAAVQRGRAHAFDVIVARYGPLVRDHVGHVVGDPALADDVTQEAFVRLFARVDQGPVAPSLRVWLLTVARRVALDQLRHRRVRRRFVERVRGGAGPPCAPPPTPARELEGAEFLAAFERALADLPEAQRSAFLLREREGLSHGEIAAVLGCELKTVSSRLHRARTALRGALGAHGLEDGGVGEDDHGR